GNSTEPGSPPVTKEAALDIGHEVCSGWLSPLRRPQAGPAVAARPRCPGRGASGAAPRRPAPPRPGRTPRRRLPCPGPAPRGTGGSGRRAAAPPAGTRTGPPGWGTSHAQPTLDRTAGIVRPLPSVLPSKKRRHGLAPPLLRLGKEVLSPAPPHYCSP